MGRAHSQGGLGAADVAVGPDTRVLTATLRVARNVPPPSPSAPPATPPPFGRNAARRPVGLGAVGYATPVEIVGPSVMGPHGRVGLLAAARGRVGGDGPTSL